MVQQREADRRVWEGVASDSLHGGIRSNLYIWFLIIREDKLCAVLLPQSEEVF